LRRAAALTDLGAALQSPADEGAWLSASLHDWEVFTRISATDNKPVPSTGLRSRVPQRLAFAIDARSRCLETGAM
jgi:hypothetical protein